MKPSEFAGCLRPWASLAPLKSLHARYLSLGFGHEILKRWKWHHGPSLDRMVLNSVPHAVLEICKDAWVVPVPQRLDRSIQLGGSPAEKIARWVSAQARVRSIRALAPENTVIPIAQARLNKDERLGRTRAFQISQPEISAMIFGRKLLLVDDFQTTGQTLRSAAETLVAAGAAEVHGFCLGVRPMKGSMSSGVWDSARTSTPN